MKEKTKKYTKRTLFFGLILIIIMIVQIPITQGAKGSREPLARSVRDYWPTDEWMLSTPEEQGMDSSILNKIMEDIDSFDMTIHSVIVVRNGYIVMENYTSYYTQSTLHTIQSCTKSLVSALIGIAIDKGYIDNVSQRVIDFFPNTTIEYMDSWKQNLTIEHCLTMTMGNEWHELDVPYSDPLNDLFAMYRSDDMWKYALDRPMEQEPGLEWAYNSGGVELLGGILEKATGYRVTDFAREFLFEPIGIDHFDWWLVPASSQYGVSGGLYLTPRDMARFGYLFLNNGTWNNTQVISLEWIEQSTQNHYDTGWYGYGYLWWIIPDTNFYQATGHYEQKIYVIPEHDIVVVFTGDVQDYDYHPTDYFVMNYVIPSLTQRNADYTLSFIFVSFFIISAIPAIVAYWKYRRT
ncbi:MAG: serine hydrolase domain-containing protein [Candidatus Thorarchaeota archaeon]